ncbi:SRPBCC family protein [Nocardia sp. NPDC006630]|uniref:type II toxin-antitoxin system Rv0910 family toxin n=1 Tax=Nocardia sp. NPDC006630 TaxID=3157181 RepID=UPI0033B21B23
MSGFEVTRALEASPMQLYSILANTSTWQEWFVMHDGFVEQPPERMSVNSTLVQNVRMLGMSHKLELTITAFKPPMQLTLAGRSEVGLICEFSFGIERRPGGSQLTIAGNFSGAMLNAQLTQVIERDAQTQLTNSMSKLAKLSEDVG